MPERVASGQLGHADATRLVAGALVRAFGGEPERLDRGTLAAAYPRRRFEGGWRIPVVFSDYVERRVDLLLSPAFPAAYPRTALVDRPDDADWPHVEGDGVLCLLPVGAEVDPDDPGAVAVNLLGRSARLVEELLAGTIVERDFREEFLTYWFYAHDQDAPRVWSLLRPDGPSRLVRVWRDRDGSAVVGETVDDLRRWLANRQGATERVKAFHTEPAALLWLSESPVPSEYPAIGSDLLATAKLADGPAAAVLAELAAGTTKDALVLLGACGRGGPGLVAVTTTAARPPRGSKGGATEPLTRGFRSAPLPAEVAMSRVFSQRPLMRSLVERADADWIHGRGADPRVRRLREAMVTFVGCGSLGSMVAARLARAGVGRAALVDPEWLGWSNVGRHELGASSVGLHKATELADRLRRDLPHLDVTGYVMGAHAFMAEHEDVLLSSDLVVCATGAWSADGGVDRWRLATGSATPFLYGWMEDHALAAHAVVVGSGAGCLACGFGRTGVPNFQALAWPEGRREHEEPACGNPFQPYGVVELGFAVDLVAHAALDALLGAVRTPVERLWLAARGDVEALGGRWSDALVARVPGLGAEGGLVAVDWPVGCARCRPALRSAA